jgi:hypothetical protein
MGSKMKIFVPSSSQTDQSSHKGRNIAQYQNDCVMSSNRETELDTIRRVKRVVPPLPDPGTAIHVSIIRETLGDKRYMNRRIF